MSKEDRSISSESEQEETPWPSPSVAWVCPWTWNEKWNLLRSEPSPFVRMGLCSVSLPVSPSSDPLKASSCSDSLLITWSSWLILNPTYSSKNQIFLSLSNRTTVSTTLVHNRVINNCNLGSRREAKTKDRQWLWKEKWFIFTISRWGRSCETLTKCKSRAKHASHYPFPIK